MIKIMISLCAALVVAVAAFSLPAQAQRHHGGTHFGGAHVGGSHFGHARVGGGHYGGRYYGGGYRGRGWGYYGGAFGLGALFGGLLGAPYYYEEPYYYPYPGYYYVPPPDDAVAYCMRRFKSYDPRSGTYLGYDGYRHPCP